MFHVLIDVHALVGLLLHSFHYKYSLPFFVCINLIFLHILSVVNSLKTCWSLTSKLFLSFNKVFDEPLSWWVQVWPSSSDIDLIFAFYRGFRYYWLLVFPRDDIYLVPCFSIISFFMILFWLAQWDSIHDQLVSFNWCMVFILRF